MNKKTLWIILAVVLLIGLLIITFFFIPFQHIIFPESIKQPDGSWKSFEDRNLYQILFLPENAPTPVIQQRVPQHISYSSNNVPEEKPATITPAQNCEAIAMKLLPKEVTYTMLNTQYDFDYSVTVANFHVLSERVFGNGGLRRAENPGENIHNYYGPDYLELTYQDLKITDSHGVILGDNIIEFLAEADLGPDGVPIANTFSVPIKNAVLTTCSLDVPDRLN